MTLDPLFVLVAGLTVLSPGPGVLLTLTNALRRNRRETAAGIAGLVTGAFLVAALSAAGLGVLLRASTVAFGVLKTIGALYLLYLAVKLWNASPLPVTDGEAAPGGARRCFAEAVSVQLTNPKLVFFYLSVFPQFVHPERPFAPQFVLLVCAYLTLIVAIHSSYAASARWSRPWLATPTGGRIVNRLGAATFAFFGAALATTRR